MRWVGRVACMGEGKCILSFAGKTYSFMEHVDIYRMIILELIIKK